MMTNTLYSTSNNNNNNKTKAAIGVNKSASNAKWTCFICLSMHKLDVEVCLICGSLQQSSTSATSRSTHLNPLVKVKKIDGCTSVDLTNAASSASTLLKSINTNNKNHGYLSKKWTCTYCSFANDCLKVVCMNCRSSKLQRHLEQENNDSKINLSKQHHALQIKRKNATTNNKTKTSTTKQNTSNEENELNNRDDEQDEVDLPPKSQNKRAKCENCCPNCQKENTKESAQITNETKSPAAAAVVVAQSQQPTLKHTQPIELITPIKCDEWKRLDALLDVDKKTQTQPIIPSSSQTLTTTSSKWTCSTCLVQNDESKTNCACCSTAKTTTTTTTAPPKPKQTELSFDQVDTSTKKITPSFFSKDAAASQPAAKWTCSACLVANDSTKNECTCCMTKRTTSVDSRAHPTSEETTKTKFSSLVAAAGSFSNFNNTPMNSSISFGLKPSLAATSEPIKFGSTGGFTLGGPVATTAPSAAGITFGNSEKQVEFLEPSPPPPAPVAIAAYENSASKPVSFGFLGNSSSSNGFSGVNATAQAFNTASTTLEANNTNSLTFSNFSSNNNNTETPKFGFGSLTSTTNPATTTTPPFFGNSFKQETQAKNSPSPFLFGSGSGPSQTSNNPNSNASKEATTTLSNPFRNQQNDVKKAPEQTQQSITTSFSTSSIAQNSTTTAPSFFQFGFSKSSNEIASQSGKTTEPTPPSLFGNSNSFGNVGFTNSNNNNTNNNTNTFNTFNNNNNNNQTEKSNNFTFGSSTTTTTTTSSSSNVFGALLTSTQQQQQQQSSTAASPFTFGKTVTPSTSLPQPFLFGAGSQTATSSSVTNSTSGFNFGNQPSTPRSTSQQSPFVFAGINGSSQMTAGSAATDSPSLQQVLGGAGTPSSGRLIKKPTRRLKKN
jgi:hypothetical protein